MSPIKFIVTALLLLLGSLASENSLSLGKASPQSTATSSFEKDDRPSSNFNNPISDSDAAEGWIALWDGSTTFGWRNVKSTRIQDGVWTFPADDSVVRTAAEFSNYELEIEYSLVAPKAAELLLRTNPTAKDPSVDHASIPLPPTRAGEVNLITVDCDEGNISDDQGLHYSESPLRGYIGFRVRTGVFKVRSLILKPKYRQDSSNLVSSENWTIDNRPVGDVNFENNQIELKGGPFHLTLFNKKLPDSGLLSDFIMQFDCKASEATNSGIFFRCIPNETLNGYEAQINNQFANNDPTQPIDCGTGGIFRRCDARRIIAENDQWFKGTIAVNGAQISIWVNGYQVTDWSDQRLSNANPRKGKRLEAGQVQIQSHDENTHVSFRNIDIEPYPQRYSRPTNLPK